MRDQDIPKVMKYVKENIDEIKQIIAFLEEQNHDTAAGTDKQKDPDDKFSDEDSHKVMDKDSDAGADEDTEDVMNEGEEEKAGTEHTSDGVDYPDVGDGTGVEGETLHEDDEVNEEEEVTEEDEVDEEEDKVEEAGTPSMGAATGAAQGVQGTQGSANDGVARFKAPIGDGKVKKRYDEGVVPLDGGADDVKAMMESWKDRPKYDPNTGGF